MIILHIRVCIEIQSESTVANHKVRLKVVKEPPPPLWEGGLNVVNTTD